MAMNKSKIKKDIEAAGKAMGLPPEFVSQEAEFNSRAAEIAEEVGAIMETAQEKQLSAQEQLEAMRLYVQSMQKTDGHSNEEVRGIIDSIHKRLTVVLNYSGLSDNLVKPLKAELLKIVSEEKERYKDE
jgi:hypothetical protein